MKKMILLLLAVLPIFSYAIDHEWNLSPHEKTYIMGEKTQVVKGGILIDLEEALILTPSLLTDEEGVYFQKYRVVHRDAYYQCPACGRMSDTGKCINPSCPLYGMCK